MHVAYSLVPDTRPSRSHTEVYSAFLRTRNSAFAAGCTEAAMKKSAATVASTSPTPEVIIAPVVPWPRLMAWSSMASSRRGSSSPVTGLGPVSLRPVNARGRAKAGVDATDPTRPPQSPGGDRSGEQRHPEPGDAARLSRDGEIERRSLHSPVRRADHATGGQAGRGRGGALPHCCGSKRPLPVRRL